MRILHLAHAFVPEMTAGAELATYFLARRLGSRHEVAVAYVSNQRDHDGVSLGYYRGVPVIRLHARPRSSPAAHMGMRHAALEHMFLEAVHEFAPDVVHIQHTTRSSLGILWRLKAAGIPFVYTLHDFWMLCPRITLMRPDGVPCAGPEEGRACVRCGCHQGRSFDPYAPSAPTSSGASARRLLRALVRATPAPLRRLVPDTLRARLATQLAEPVPATSEHSPEAVLYADRARAFLDALGLPNRWISPSLHLRERFIAHGVAPERIVHMPYVLEDLPPRAPLKVTAPVTIGYLGTLFPHKGVHLLVEAANGMDPRAARFVIAGKGDPGYTAQLQAHATNPSIEFVGEVTREGLPGFLAGIHALAVTPIWYENAPLVVQEAMAAGRPVIGARIGGIPEAVSDRVNGLLFPPGDVDALRALLNWVAADPGLVERLAEALPPRPDPEVAARAHEELYRQVLAEQSR